MQCSAFVWNQWCHPFQICVLGWWHLWSTLFAQQNVHTRYSSVKGTIARPWRDKMKCVLRSGVVAVAITPEVQGYTTPSLWMLSLLALKLHFYMKVLSLMRSSLFHLTFLLCRLVFICMREQRWLCPCFVCGYVGRLQLLRSIYYSLSHWHLRYYKERYWRES